MLPSSPSVRNRDMSAAWRHVDFVLIGLVLSVAVLGSMMIYSATRSKDVPIAFIDKHVVFLTIGIGAMIGMATIDYMKLREWARFFYVGSVLSLIAVLIPGIGSEHKGIRAWYDIGPIQIQPAEISKVVVIATVATYLGTQLESLTGRHLAVALGLFGVPMALINFQPDLGTNLVFVIIAMGMFVIAGIPGKYIVALVAVGIIGIVGILNSDALGQYQKDRLTAFADPNGASKAAVYNTKQAQTAISLGGLSGRGYLKGEYTKGGSVPEQQTDFIFTVPGEEFGFVGSSLLLVLLGGIVWRVWRTAQIARDQVGTLICVGVLCMLVFHIFENVGMNLGIMPVTGIPLPFVSYGGSSTIAAFAAIGLVLNVHMRRFT